jgi:F-type H+-transporting ATPase subunit epsilon
MTTGTFSFKVLTPNRTAFDGEVVSVVAPGGAGYLGILAHHAPLITTLTSGDLTVRTRESRVQYRIGPGILKVVANQAVVLTESIEETSRSAA